MMLARQAPFLSVGLSVARPLPLACLLSTSPDAAGPSGSASWSTEAGPARTEQSGGAPPPLPPPLLPGSSRGDTHWLDRHLPGLRLWLEEKNRVWWIKGLVEGRCKQHHQLEGREQEVRRAIETEFQAALLRHQDAAVDERAETHLQVACLVLATHKVLLPWLRDESEVLKIIGEHMGGKTVPLLRFLLQATKFMHRDGYAVLSSRLRGLRLDMGAGFSSQLELGQQESRLTITRCFYNELFREEGKPQLAAACCCSQDQLWFEAQYRGVAAGRTAAISSGDEVCCFEVRRVQP